MNIKKLKQYCNAEIESDIWQNLGFTKYQVKNGKRFYYFKDNNAKILAVAHLDFVGEQTHSTLLHLPHKDMFFSPVLDDRLGVYIILDLLPKMLGDNAYDILLTNEEEIGMSTADLFKSDRQYNWMFQFDRAGTDVVMYNYESPEMVQLLRESEFKVGIGSYTDICELEHLKCKGFNFGTSYYHQHSLDCHADLTELQTNISKFVKFYKTNRKKYYKHDKSSYNYYSNKYYDNYSYCEICESCGKIFYEEDFDKLSDYWESISNENLCPNCLKRYHDSKQ